MGDQEEIPMQPLAVDNAETEEHGNGDPANVS